jgi:hypothetical protein
MLVLVSSLGPKDTTLLDLKKELVLYKIHVPKRLISSLSYIKVRVHPKRFLVFSLLYKFRL